MSERELTVDVLVVGSGNGGLTAALCAYELGLKDGDAFARTMGR